MAKKARTWQGNVPSVEDGYELNGAVQCEDLEWGVYVRTGRDGNLAIKVACHGSAKHKANYWLVWYSGSKCFWYTKDLLSLKSRLVLFKALCSILETSPEEVESRYLEYKERSNVSS